MADKVLIVDDDSAIRTLLEKVMKSNDLETSSASSGQDALDLLKKNTYDVILMDIMLGDMEGFEVIKLIRKQGIQTPVIIISGRDEDYDALYGLSLGADDYITKPFRPLIVGAKVKALIRRDKGQMMNTVTCGPFTYDTSTVFIKMARNWCSLQRKAAFSFYFCKIQTRFLQKKPSTSTCGAIPLRWMTTQLWFM